MANITEPDVIDYVNRVIRPIADRMIGLNATIDIEASTWFATVSPALSGAAGADVVMDGSELDGRTQLTKDDVVSFVTQMLAFQTQLDGGGVFDVINKPKVNVLMP